MVVVIAGQSPACQRIAAKYGALVIGCDPLRKPNATLKSILYSIGNYVDAEQYLCLDVDTLILGDLRPIFAAMSALPEKSILVCRESNRIEFRDLTNALCTVYYGNQADLERFLVTPEEARYSFVVNDGVFGGSKAALLELDRTIRGIPGAAAWIDERADVTWRNQWVFNLALARLNCAAELCPTYNVQMNCQDVAINERENGIVATIYGKPARIIHFNGVGRHKHINLRRMFGQVHDPLVAQGASDQFPRFLGALHRWIGRRGQSAMSWTFYGTGDGRTASIPDPQVMSMLALLHYLVRSSGYSRILESGTGLGVSTACLASAVSHLSDSRVVTYDVCNRPGREELWQACPADIRDRIETRTGDSLAGMERACVAGEQFDLALLDSSHDGEHVWKEFQLATRLVKPNGLILIHDVTNEWETAGEAVPRIEAAGYGVVRLWGDRPVNSDCAGLGLAVIENRRGGLARE